MNDLATEVVDAIKALRLALAKYELLADAEKKDVRYNVYQRQGQFGKVIFKEFEPLCTKI